MASDPESAHAILSALGIRDAQLSPLGVGFASDAWLVTIGEMRQVLRIATFADDPVTYPAEHAVMTRLRVAGATVPEPVGGSWQLRGWRGPAFSLTTWLPGTSLQPDARSWAHEPIAAFLRIMHGLPVQGFGPLVEVEGRVRGVLDEAEPGAIEAWSGAPLWPLGDAALARHPAIRELPVLAKQMERHVPAVRASILGVPPVLVHGDLHEENILQDGGSLSFIDFGVAFVGAPAWEFAAIGYFLGWDLADRTLEQYLEGAGDIDRWRSSIAAVALSLGARRWEQDREYDLSEDDHNSLFLHEALERISASRWSDS